MQGQRGIVGSLPETLDFDHGTTSGAIVDPQICWNNVRNPAESRLADFMPSSSHMNNTYGSSIDHERQNMRAWRLDGPSSSGAQDESSRDHERKMGHGWPSSVTACDGAGSRSEERRYEPTNILSLDRINVNPQFVQSSSSNTITQNLNLNASLMGHGGANCHVMEGSSMYKPGGAENDQIPSSSSSDNLFLPSGGGGFLVEENDGRPGCSLDGRRQSSKRKAIEDNIGQSSMSGSSSFFEHSEGSPWPGIPARGDDGNSLHISAPAEQGLGLGARGLASNSILDSAASGHAESSQRNFRMRINPSNRESVPPPFFGGSSARRSAVPASHQSSRLISLDHSLDFRSLPAVDGTSSQSQPVVIPVPALLQNVQPFRWNESSSSRTGSSLSSVPLGDRGEGSSRSIARNIWQHPVFVPTVDLRPSVRNIRDRSATNGNMIPGNIASTSRTEASSGVHPLSAATWVPPASASSRNSRRLAEYVRRSLFSSSAAESGGHGSTHSALHSAPSTPSEETMVSSGAGHHGHRRSYPRSASSLDRQGEGVLGIPYTLQTLTAAGEGRSRLVSEIRNVLDLMRRGESLRFEDVVILDQSVFLGVADMHDRHRDMRLDVDNMTYEELLALEERIGNVSTGLSEETIVKKLKQRKFSGSVALEVEAEPCCICQEDYNNGEDVGTLDCGHDFHTDCVKQWLMLKNWCPICKTTGLAT